jgi:hypothetical protein
MDCHGGQAMKNVQDYLNNAIEILTGIKTENFMSSLNNGPTEQSAFFMIGRALGCIDAAMSHIKVRAKHEESDIDGLDWGTDELCGEMRDCGDK